MRTISWTKQPLIILFAAAIAAGCGSDSKPAASADAGLSKLCGNGTLDKGEACDGTNLNGKTCGTATAGLKTGSGLTCKSCVLDTTACTTAAGSGGAINSAGGASAGGAPQGGKGGAGGKKPKTDAGTDSGSGGTSGTDASVDASKD